MVQNGWEADVLLSRHQEPVTAAYEVDGVNVIPFEDNRQLIHAALASQLLISHLECYERVAVVGRRYRVPVVHVVHNDMDITKGYMAQGCDLAVFNTDWVRDSFLERPVGGSRLNANGLTVVHPRVDTSRFSPRPESLSEGLNGIGPDVQYDVALVNLWDGSAGGRDGKGKDGKGAHTFYEMARRFPEKQFLGVVGGYGVQRIENYPNVTILPHSTNMVQDVYSRTRVLLMPSRYESFGRVAVEGAACGVPTIASPTPGLKEALGKSGLYADPDDYDSWESWLGYMDNDSFYQEKSAQALDRADYWYRKQPEELDDFLRKANSIAHTGFMLRGY